MGPSYGTWVQADDFEHKQLILAARDRRGTPKAVRHGVSLGELFVLVLSQQTYCLAPGLV
jgi:hypothetical protein